MALRAAGRGEDGLNRPLHSGVYFASLVLHGDLDEDIAYQRGIVADLEGDIARQRSLIDELEGEINDQQRLISQLKGEIATATCDEVHREELEGDGSTMVAPWWKPRKDLSDENAAPW
eukprot:1179077-Prorocentrum_minimum.AAC.3